MIPCHATAAKLLSLFGAMYAPLRRVTRPKTSAPTPGDVPVFVANPASAPKGKLEARTIPLYKNDGTTRIGAFTVN